jgi:hypothetical protein
MNVLGAYLTGSDDMRLRARSTSGFRVSILNPSRREASST